MEAELNNAMGTVTIYASSKEKVKKVADFLVDAYETNADKYIIHFHGNLFDGASANGSVGRLTFNGERKNKSISCRENFTLTPARLGQLYDKKHLDDFEVCDFNWMATFAYTEFDIETEGFYEVQFEILNNERKPIKDWGFYESNYKDLDYRLYMFMTRFHLNYTQTLLRYFPFYRYEYDFNDFDTRVMEDFFDDLYFTGTVNTDSILGMLKFLYKETKNETIIDELIYYWGDNGFEHSDFAEWAKDKETLLLPNFDKELVENFAIIRSPLYPDEKFSLADVLEGVFENPDEYMNLSFEQLNELLKEAGFDYMDFDSYKLLNHTDKHGDLVPYKS